MTKDNMIVQLKLVDFLQKLQVQRVTEYKDFDFDKLPDRLFKFKGGAAGAGERANAGGGFLGGTPR